MLYAMDGIDVYELNVKDGFFLNKLTPKFFAMGYRWTGVDETFAILAYKQSNYSVLEGMLNQATVPAEYGEMSPLLSLSVGAVYSPPALAGEFSLPLGLQHATWRQFLLEILQFPEQVLLKTTHDPSVSVRETLASLDSLPLSVQEILAFDREKQVRLRLLQNPHVDIHWKTIVALQ